MAEKPTPRVEPIPEHVPKVGIIVPARNAQTYLPECIESVLAQTFTDFELVIVVGDSTDDTAALAEAYAQKDERITVVHHHRDNLAFARAEGIDATKAPWVLFLDADDLLTSPALEALVSYAEDMGLEQLFFDIDAFASDAVAERRLESVRASLRRNAEYPRPLPGIDLFSAMVDRGDYHHSLLGQMVRRSLIQRADMRPTQTTPSDMAFGVALTLCSKRSGCLRRTLYRKRLHAGSLAARRRTLRDVLAYARGLQGMGDYVVKTGLDTPKVRDTLLKHMRAVSKSGAGELIDSFPASEPSQQVDQAVLDFTSKLDLEEAVWLYLVVCQRALLERDQLDLLAKLADVSDSKGADAEKIADLEGEVSRLSLLLEYGTDEADRETERQSAMSRQYVAPWRSVPTTFIVPATAPKISVIIPVLDAAEHLEQCLDSICSQTFYEIEIIYVDRGSTDASLQILMDRASHDARIEVYTQQGSTTGAARNAGMARAKGTYLIFWEADDFFESTSLERLYNRCEETHAQVCVCGSRQLLSHSTETYPVPESLDMSRLPRFETFARQNNEEHILDFTTPAVHNKIFSRRFVEHEGLQFQDLDAGADTLFTCMALCLAKRITTLDRRLVTHRSLGRVGKDAPTDALLGPIGALADTAVALKERRCMPEKSFSRRACADLAEILRDGCEAPTFGEAVKLLQNIAPSELGVSERQRGWYLEEWHHDFVRHLLRDRPTDLERYLSRLSWEQALDAQALGIRRSEQIRTLNTQAKRSRAQLEKARAETRRLMEQNRRLAERCKLLERQGRMLAGKAQELEEELKPIREGQVLKLGGVAVSLLRKDRGRDETPASAAAGARAAIARAAGPKQATPRDDVRTAKVEPEVAPQAETAQQPEATQVEATSQVETTPQPEAAPTPTPAAEASEPTTSEVAAAEAASDAPAAPQVDEPAPELPAETAPVAETPMEEAPTAEHPAEEEPVVETPSVEETPAPEVANEATDEEEPSGAEVTAKLPPISTTSTAETSEDEA